MQASDLMSTPVITIRSDATVGDAARLMLERGTSCLPVLDDEEKLVGILTHTDFGLHPAYRPLIDNLYSLLGSFTTPAHLEELAHRISNKLVKDVMRHPVVTVEEDASIAKVTELMLRDRVHRLPVVRGAKLVGIITRHDLLKLIVSNS